jgi:hypothetical protein
MHKKLIMHIFTMNCSNLLRLNLFGENFTRSKEKQVARDSIGFVHTNHSMTNPKYLILWMANASDPMKT